MLFNSWEFLVLCIVTIGLYYLPPLTGNKVWQVTVLLVASALFYAWEEPRLLVLLGASCLLNAIAVERILFWKRNQESGVGCQGSEVGDQGTGVRGRVSGVGGRETGVRGQESEIPAKRWLFWTVALNLGFLAFFKYAGFLANLFPDTLFPVSCKLWLTDIPLPVGISFYTFQGISLVVDVWRNDISTQTGHSLAGRGKDRIRSIRDTSFYVAFFPQLVAGPIVKAHEFVDQIGAKRFADIDWLTVRRCLILGYFLKIFVADNLAEQTGVLALGAEQLAATGPINLMSLLYGYSLQIFADFGGYSLIAIGLGALFGYKLPPNFNFPYLSTSITEFWRRWHLSLSSWLRDYLYIPLGGNRKGSGRTYFNLFLVMFLGGLWHGAAWKFALWGSLHGLFLAAERLVARRKGSGVGGQGAGVVGQESGVGSQESGVGSQESGVGGQESKERHLESIYRDQQSTIINQQSSINPQSPISNLLISFTKWLLTFHLVTALWLTFMMPDMASIAAFFQGVFSGRTGFSGPPIFSLLFYGGAVALYHLWGWLREHHVRLSQQLARSPLEPLLHGVMIFLILTNPGAPRGFIYFQF